MWLWQTEQCFFKSLHYWGTRMGERTAVEPEYQRKSEFNSAMIRQTGPILPSYTRRERSITTTLLVRGTSNAISPTRFPLSFVYVRHCKIWLRHQSDVRGYYHVVFWPRDSKTIFEVKMAQLWALIKSLVFKLDVSNFGILFFKR